MKTINVLIVSNNQLSTTDSNGKTLLSIFNDNYYNIFQIYIKEANNPSNKACQSLYLNEYEITKVNKIIRSHSNTVSLDTINIKKNTIKQLLREILWKASKTQYDRINSWIEGLNIDIIFFLMGDSLFMCDIVEYLKSKLNVPIFTYITDVYTNKEGVRSITEAFHKSLIYKKQKSILKITDQLYTISEKMKEFYIVNFQVESKLLRNVTKFQFNNYLVDKKNNFIYAGNLYYGRDKVLMLFSEALKKYNKENMTNYKLIIYSNSISNTMIEKELEKNEFLIYKGLISQDELIKVLLENKYTMVVESFEKVNISKVRYSFSTKITELASIGKFIIGIGPDSVSSISELSKFTYCITKCENMSLAIKEIVNSNILEFEERARKYSLENFNSDEQNKNFKDEISKFVNYLS